MTDTPKPPSPHPSSEDDPRVQAYRKRLESFDERTMPMLEAANERLNQAMSDAPNPHTSPLAGEWSVTIRGRGPHHNAAETDANRIAGLLVVALLGAGQELAVALFSNGAEEDLLHPARIPPLPPPDKETP